MSKLRVPSGRSRAAKAHPEKIVLWNGTDNNGTVEKHRMWPDMRCNEMDMVGRCRVEHQHGMWSTVRPAASGADSNGLEPDRLGGCRTILVAML